MSFVMNWLRPLMAMWWRALLVCWCMAHAGSALAAVTLSDDRGAAVTLPAPPQRIVSLLPSLTEMVCALDACSRIVGVDRYSNFPAAMARVPKVGSLDDASVEMIVALKPDVVLAAMSSRVMSRLEQLGVKVLALEPRSYADVQRVASRVAILLGKPQAGEVLWQSISHQVDEVSAQVPAGVRGWRVYYEVDSAPYAAGESSFIGETLSHMSVRNIVPASLGPFPKLNPEYVVRADPDVIMVSQRSARGLADRPGWSRIQAVRHQRICTFDAAQTDVLFRPGPRMGEAAGIMLRCLQSISASKGGR